MNKSNDFFIGKHIQQYEIIEKLGSGGNADVYQVKNKNNQIYAMKLLKVYKNRGFEKKYERFKDEVKVVLQTQDEIDGMIPILDHYLPDDPSITNRPWYTMPLATPLSDVLVSDDTDKKASTEEVIRCVRELARTLITLHDKNIVHRDIKPSNLYKYQDRWVYGDFGLVDYPEKTDLTAQGESVGPRYTIAPEMKRDAKHADGKPADLYSLAKTLWILLTGNKDGFEGQYLHTTKQFNISQYRKGEFFVTLHQLLEKSTSNDPYERPTAQEFFNTLDEWFKLKGDFEKRNMIEWEFVISTMFPYTLPEVVSWSNPKDIATILDTASSFDSLNHMFMPGGGGMDLRGCKVSNEPGYIELDFGYISKIKPKKLSLVTFPESYDWNYFYLETEENPPSGLYSYDDLTDIFDEQVLEVSPGHYIEPYHLNYGHYNGTPLSSSVRKIILGLKGSYVIFAKSSTYNSNPSTYDGRHNTMGAVKFHGYIKRSIDYIRWAKENPALAEESSQERRRQKQRLNEIQRQMYMEKDRLLRIDWEKHLSNLTLPYLSIDRGDLTRVEMVNYVTFHDQHYDKKYYLSKENTLVEYASGNWQCVLAKIENIEECFLFTSFDQAVEYVRNLKQLLFPGDDFNEISEISIFDIVMHRRKKPQHMFSKDELEQLLRNADDKVPNRIVIDINGNLQLINEHKIDDLEKKRFAFLGERFPAYANSVGQKAELTNIQEIYLDLLDGWFRHLNQNKRTSSSDYIEEREESVFLQLIQESLKAYSE